MPSLSDGTTADTYERPVTRRYHGALSRPTRRAQPANGIIALTLAAEFALHTLPIRGRAKTIDQLTERHQVRDPERAPLTRKRDERVRCHSVRPPNRQRPLSSVVIEEEHAILAPRLPDPDQHELLPHPRVERMRHPNSLLTARTERS